MSATEGVLLIAIAGLGAYVLLKTKKDEEPPEPPPPFGIIVPKYDSLKIIVGG